jgi:hypothetical protein
MAANNTNRFKGPPSLAYIPERAFIILSPSVEC